MTLARLEPELARVMLSQIDEPALPSRTTMDDAALEELAASIRRDGFTSAIVLARVGDRYEVIAGHRRWHAARMAGLIAVPALIYATKADGIEAIQHSENKLREELSPADEAVWFNELYERHKAEGTDGVAARVGEKRAYVEGRLALLHGHEAVFRALKANAISLGVAQQINRCPDTKHVAYILDIAVQGGMTVGVAQQHIRDYEMYHRHMSGDAPPAGGEAVSGPPIADEYFTCRVCGLTENPHEMRPVQIHRYCHQAVFLPALAFFQRRSDYLTRPRTHDEAIELVASLLELFPSLGEVITLATPS